MRPVGRQGCRHRASARISALRVTGADGTRPDIPPAAPSAGLQSSERPWAWPSHPCLPYPAPERPGNRTPAAGRQPTTARRRRAFITRIHDAPLWCAFYVQNPIRYLRQRVRNCLSNTFCLFRANASVCPKRSCKVPSLTFELR